MIWFHDLATKLTKRYGRVIHPLAILGFSILLFARLLRYFNPDTSFSQLGATAPYIWGAAYVYCEIYILLGTVVLGVRFFRWLHKKFPFLPPP